MMQPGTPEYERYQRYQQALNDRAKALFEHACAQPFPQRVDTQSEIAMLERWMRIPANGGTR